jgi:hypothetical protein
MVVIKDAQRFDYVGDRDPAVAGEKQVFPVLLVRRRGEVVGTEVDGAVGLSKSMTTNLWCLRLPLPPAGSDSKGSGTLCPSAAGLTGGEAGNTV